MGMDHYMKVKDLGGTNEAFLATDRQDVRRRVVIKRLGHGSDGMEELSVALRVQHDNIVRFLESFIHEGCLYVVTRYEPGGDLDELITRLIKLNKTPTTLTVLRWFVQLLTAVAHCHENKVMHRDIKPGNIFLSEDTTQLILGDFGSAKAMHASNMTSTFVGSPMWLSPELLQGKSYSFSSDIWSLGCVFYEVCTLTRPFAAPNFVSLIQNVTSGEMTPFPLSVPPSVRGIIMSMLVVDSEQRCTAAAALQRAQRALREEEQHSPPRRDRPGVPRQQPAPPQQQQQQQQPADGARNQQPALVPTPAASEAVNNPLLPAPASQQTDTPPPPSPTPSPTAAAQVSPSERAVSVRACTPTQLHADSESPEQPPSRSSRRSALDTPSKSRQHIRSTPASHLAAIPSALIPVDPPRTAAPTPLAASARRRHSVITDADLAAAADLSRNTKRLSQPSDAQGSRRVVEKKPPSKPPSPVPGSSRQTGVIGSVIVKERPPGGSIATTEKKSERPSVSNTPTTSDLPANSPLWLQIEAPVAKKRRQKPVSAQPLQRHQRPSPARRRWYESPEGPVQATAAAGGAVQQHPVKREAGRANQRPAAVPLPAATSSRSLSPVASAVPVSPSVPFTNSVWAARQEKELCAIEDYLHKFRDFDADVLNTYDGLPAKGKAKAQGRIAAAVQSPERPARAKIVPQRAPLGGPAASPPRAPPRAFLAAQAGLQPLGSSDQYMRKKSAPSVPTMRANPSPLRQRVENPSPMRRQVSHNKAMDSSHATYMQSHRPRQASHARATFPMSSEERDHTEQDRLQAREKREAERAKMKEMIQAQRAKKGRKKGGPKLEVEIVLPDSFRYTEPGSEARAES